MAMVLTNPAQLTKVEVSEYCYNANYNKPLQLAIVFYTIQNQIHTKNNNLYTLMCLDCY